MKRIQFERIMRSVNDTRDDEISCSECFERVSEYVDLEITGKDAAERMPRVKQHLGQCRVCREEHETLLELARLEGKDADSRNPMP